MIELENWCAYFFKKKYLLLHLLIFFPNVFGKTSIFDKAQSNEKDKDKDKYKDKNKDIGTNNMDLVWQANHGYITGHSTISAVQLSLQPHNRPSSF